MHLTKVPSFHLPGIVVGAIFILIGPEGRADEPIPTAFPQGRYETVRMHSPFAVATAEVAPVPAGASFAANWFVSGIARIGDNDFVTIKSHDLSTQFSLFGKGDIVNEVALASVTWSDSVGQSTVILRKGTETAKLEFNEADIKAAPQPQGPVASPQPGAKPVPGNVVPRPINRMPVTPMGIPGQPVPPPGGPAIRRRAQVIQPPQ